MGDHGIQRSLWNNKKAMINSGKMRILVVDSTKFDQTAFSVAGKLRDMRWLCNRQKPSEKWLEHFATKIGVDCRYRSVCGMRDSKRNQATERRPLE